MSVWHWFTSGRFVGGGECLDSVYQLLLTLTHVYGKSTFKSVQKFSHYFGYSYDVMTAIIVAPISLGPNSKAIPHSTSMVTKLPMSALCDCFCTLCLLYVITLCVHVCIQHPYYLQSLLPTHSFIPCSCPCARKARKKKISTVTGLEPAIPRSEVWCLIH